MVAYSNINSYIDCNSNSCSHARTITEMDLASHSISRYNADRLRNELVRKLNLFLNANHVHRDHHQHACQCGSRPSTFVGNNYNFNNNDQR